MTAFSDHSASNGADCLITGVTLFERDTSTCKPGDLFQLGGAWIVNAAGEGEERVPYVGEKVASYSQSSSAFFTRRNVYIFARGDWLLNDAAIAYIERSL